jgi:hypothetical protein
VWYNNYSKERKENKKMLEMICTIPESIGWTMVGAVGMFCVVMLVKIGGVIIEAIKERRKGA